MMLGILAVASSSGNSLICWAPIMIHGALTCAWISREAATLSGVYATIINLIRKTGLMDKILASQDHLYKLRHDIEVYMGVYLTLGIFFGLSGLL